MADVENAQATEEEARPETGSTGVSVQSGGVDIQAGQVSAGADIVGRDKIVHEEQVGGDKIGGDKIVHQTVISIHGTPSPGTESRLDSTIPIAEARESLRDYKNRLRSALGIQFPRPGTEFNLTFRTGADTAATGDQQSAGRLIELTQQARRVILHGVAGGGKTTLLRRLATHLLEGEDVVPLCLNLRNWKAEYYTQWSDKPGAELVFNEAAFDVLLKVSIADLNWETLSSFNNVLHVPQFVMVDGLNEVYSSDVAKRIIELLSEYIRTITRACVLVTDRMNERSLPTRWHQVWLDTLDEQEIYRLLRAQIGSGRYREPSDVDKRLLAVPYFLDHWLKEYSPLGGSRASAIGSFFITQMDLTEAEVSLLAKVAFESYKEHQSLFISLVELRDAVVNEEVINKLKVAEVLKKVGDNHVQFAHQLQHDYLASRYLAQDEELWNASSFDAVSFRSASFDALSMALDQISNIPLADKFIERVYDWNWSATAACMSDAAVSTPKRYSMEIEVFVLASVASKLFDPIHGTRQSAKNALSVLPSFITDPFTGAGSLEKIVAFVRVYESNEPWFVSWKGLFARPSNTPLSEDEINQIADRDPRIGWTASNVVRRFPLQEVELRQIRTIYNSFGENSFRDNAVRWRAIHSMGGFGTEENVHTLLRALDKDHYFWARYGAIRSLVEIAATTNVEQIRQYVVSELQKRVMHLERVLQDEIGRAAFYRGAPDTWENDVIELLCIARDAQERKSDRERWEKLIADFQDFTRGGYISERFNSQ